MEEDNKFLRPYVMGTSIGMAEGITPVRGLESAVNWGSPVVQLEGSPAMVGRTGLQVIKELAKHNKVKLTWHSPPSKDWELAVPDKDTNELASRQYDLLLEAAKASGTELINTHVTYAIPRLTDDKVLIYDVDEKQLGLPRLPSGFREAVEKAETPEEVKKIKQEFIDQLNKEKVTGVRQQLMYHERLANRSEQEKKEIDGIITSIKNYPEMAKSKFLTELTPYKLEVMRLARQVLGESVDIEKEEDRKKVVEKLEDAKKKAEEEFKAEKERADFLTESYGDRLKTGVFYSDGFEATVQNFADNLAPIVDKAMKKGIKFTVENSDSRFAFSTPEEIMPALDALYKKLRELGHSENEIKQYVGYCFDSGHANTIAGLKVGGKTVEPPLEQMKQVTDKYPLMYVHYSENFGDVDAHMPVGEGTKEGEEYDKKLKELQKFLAEKDFKGDMIHEIGNLGGLGYRISLQRAAPGIEYSPSGVLTEGFSSPSFSYVAGAENVDPLLMEKPNYFYGSWASGMFLP